MTWTCDELIDVLRVAAERSQLTDTIEEIDASGAARKDVLSAIKWVVDEREDYAYCEQDGVIDVWAWIAGDESGDMTWRLWVTL